MRARWPLFVTMLAVVFAYGAYPYVTLFRLGLAIHSADAATLQRLVDWPAVREGIKEDVCDLVVDDAPSNSSQLAPFGASFMRGIASSSIDQAVTPEALVKVAMSPAAEPIGHRATKAEPQKDAPVGADVHVDWAFFDSPTTFLVSLRTQGQAAPIKLEMDLKDGVWQVDRVWLPADLLAPGSKT
jgi:hypothetical protein